MFSRTCGWIAEILHGYARIHPHEYTQLEYLVVNASLTIPSSRWDPDVARFLDLTESVLFRLRELCPENGRDLFDGLVLDGLARILDSVPGFPKDLTEKLRAKGRSLCQGRSPGKSVAVVWEPIRILLETASGLVRSMEALERGEP